MTTDYRSLVDALCAGKRVYDSKGNAYEMWELDHDKPGLLGVRCPDLSVDEPRPEPPPDPNANRQKVGWATAVRRLIRNPTMIGHDGDGRRYWWGVGTNAVFRTEIDGSLGDMFMGHPEFLYFDKVEAR
jgi:hypothetical protein